MNKVLLTGNLSKNMELRRTTTGKAVCSGTIAVNRTFKTDDGVYPTDFIDIVLWGDQAEFASKWLRKGTKVEIVGSWQTRYYTSKDGTERKVCECLVENIRSLESLRKNSDEETQDTTNRPSVPYAIDEDEKPTKSSQGSSTFDDFTDEDLPF